MDLIDFLDKHDVEYVVKNKHVVAGVINLYDRKIFHLPENIGMLKCDQIDLSRNFIRNLPDSIVDMKCNYLNLSENELTKLPDDIGKLECKILNVCFNKLSTLPESIIDLKCEALYLAMNKFKSLPDNFGEITLKRLSLVGNPLEPCLWMFKQWDNNVKLFLDETSMYKRGATFVEDYRKEIDLAYELRKPDNAGIKSMFDMGLF